jgi:23S rRNA (pseudouridine1915-N3)-methyltransferase
MSREILVVWAGRHRRDDWEKLCSGYRRRIGRWIPVRDLPVRARGRGEGKDRRRAEGRVLLAALPDSCWPVALDRRGRMLSSAELSAWLARRLGRGQPVAFLVGSDLGLGEEALAAARERISFGPLTLPHELARLLLYEQLYRALSIAAGMEYHRQPP